MFWVSIMLLWVVVFYIFLLVFLNVVLLGILVRVFGFRVSRGSLVISSVILVVLSVLVVFLDYYLNWYVYSDVIVLSDLRFLLIYGFSLVFYFFVIVGFLAVIVGGIIYYLLEDYSEDVSYFVYLESGIALVYILFNLTVGSFIDNVYSTIFMFTYVYTLLDYIQGLLFALVWVFGFFFGMLVIIFGFSLDLESDDSYLIRRRSRKSVFISGRQPVYLTLSVILFLLGVVISVVYGPKIVLEGIFLNIVGMSFIIVSVVALTLFVLDSETLRKADMWRIRKQVIAISFILVILISSITFLSIQKATVEKNGLNQILSTKVNYSYNIDEVPIVLDNLRLIDRDLAKDFIATFSLPSPKTGWSVSKLLEYEANGIVDGKVAWVVPFKYQTVFSRGRDTNKIAGFIWLYLKDTPLPENIQYEYYEMDVGPGLLSFRNLFTWFKVMFPNYHLSEWYSLRKEGKWYWVILADKLIGNVYFTEKVVLVESFNKYTVLTPSEALNMGIPQVISSMAIKDSLLSIGNYLRKNRIDFTAPGVPLIEPTSPDRLIALNEPFYYRPHHFLLRNGTWFGRDFYLQVRISEKMNSVVLATAINDTIKIIDLRGYKRGELQGVSTPSNALNILEEIANESIGAGNIAVRYPKLYKLRYGNQTVLFWLALAVEVMPGGDIFRGAVFVDAVDTRIRGIIHYTFGEPREVFIQRLKQYIEITYKSFTAGNQTTVRTGVILNGTIIAKGWALEGTGADMSYVLTFRVLNGSKVVVVIAKEEYMETKEQWYLATTLGIGERVNMDVRFDPERQVWMLYRLEILS